MSNCVVVGLGGNAILGPKDRGTAEEQLSNLSRTARTLLDIIEAGYRLVITHGNGPQIGAVLLQNEAAKSVVPAMPIDICVAETQGMLGYLIEKSLRNEALARGREIEIATILTQTLVRRDDPAFSEPSKPVGPFYAREEALKLERERNYRIIEDSGRGWRRVVPSPEPVGIVEAPAVEKLIDDGFVVIANGGGGIPVLESDDELVGVEAVVDKDLSSQKLATQIHSTSLLLLTDVRKVSLNFAKRNQTELDQMTIEEARRYLAAGHFLRGSMEPKVRAAIQFVEAGGRLAVIGALEDGFGALKGERGTKILPVHTDV